MGNLAQQLNKQTLGMAKGIFSLPATVPQLGGGYGTDPTLTIPGYRPGGQDGLNQYAKGGLIKGPGTGTSDSITAELPVDGAIIPAHIVELYGQDYFDKLEAAVPNAGGDKQKITAKVSTDEYQLSPEAVAFWGADVINKLIGAENEGAESDMPAYAEGGIVETELQQRLANPETLARSAEQTQGLRAKLDAPAPTLGLRDRMGMPPVETPPTLQQRMPLAQANMQAQNQVMRNDGFTGNLNGQQRPSLARVATQVMPRALAANAVDAGSIANAANDFVTQHEYQHPEYKDKLQAMFPRFAEGGIVEEQKFDDAGIPVLDNITNNVKSLGNAVLAPIRAVGNASRVDPNAMRIQQKPSPAPSLSGVVRANSSVPSLAQASQADSVLASNPQPTSAGVTKPQSLANSFGMEPTADGLGRPRTFQDVTANRMDNDARNAWIAQNAAKEDVLAAQQPPSLQGALGPTQTGSFLADRGKMMQQNEEANRQQRVADEIQYRNYGHVFSNPQYNDVLPDSERLGAKSLAAISEKEADRKAGSTAAAAENQREYDKMNQTKEIEQAKLKAPKIGALKMDDGSIGTYQESGEGAVNQIQQQQALSNAQKLHDYYEQNQNATISSEHLSELKKWLPYLTVSTKK